MSVYDIIVARRSVRQFLARPVERATLERLVNAGRLAPSAANLQPLEFLAVDDEAVRAKIFPALRWAAYIHPDGDPGPGREPRAYVFVLVNTRIREKMYEYDVGAAVEAMAVAALAEGVGSCWLISIDRPAVQDALAIPEGYKIDSVLALGYPDETSVVEPFKDSPKYWKDLDGTFHVPKRAIEDVFHLNKF